LNDDKDNNFLAVPPKLAKQWHPVKNGTLTPDKIMAGSGMKVWWQCDKGHEWQTKVYTVPFFCLDFLMVLD
jgi:hypothetical protein